MTSENHTFDPAAVIEAALNLRNMLNENHDLIVNHAGDTLYEAMGDLNLMWRSIEMRQKALGSSKKKARKPQHGTQKSHSEDAPKQCDCTAGDVKTDPSGQPNRESGITRDDEYPKQKAKPSTPCAECAKAAVADSELKPDLNCSDTKLPEKRPKLAGRRTIAAIFISVVALALGTAPLAVALSSDLRKAVFSAAVFQTASANSRHSSQVATAIILGHSGQVTSLVCEPVKPTTSDVASQLE